MPIPLFGNFFKDMKITTQPSGYPENWSEISEAFRKKCEYICAICGVDCSTHSYLTDAHHLNSDKSDCRDTNLQCLCKFHHAQQHSHYKIKENDLQSLQKLWEDQGIHLAVS